MTRELLQQALDALRQCEFTSPPAQRPIVKEAITALREALAAPMPEPVAINYVPLHEFATRLRISYNELCAAVHDSLNIPSKSMIAAPPAAPAPATSADYAMGYAEGFNDACKPAPVVREPIIDEMDAVASRYAHKLALDLECVLSDYNGKWWDTAMQTLGEYREAMNQIHERESPTHMGEPVLPKISSGVGK